MKFFFSIRFDTKPGQNIWLRGRISRARVSDRVFSLPLHYAEGGFWEGSREDCEGAAGAAAAGAAAAGPAAEGPAAAGTASADVELAYKYFLEDTRTFPARVLRESGGERKVRIAANCACVRFQDRWRDDASDSVFFTSPFKVFHPEKPRDRVLHADFLLIEVRCPLTAEGEALYLCGNRPETGSWNLAAALPMQPSADGSQAAFLPLSVLNEGLEYKFVKRTACGEWIWEQGENHRVPRETATPASARCITHPAGRFAPPRPRYAGVAVPLFALRSESGAGIGDFGDLPAIAAWAAACGQRFIQLLPVNDTCSTGKRTDSYPYACISVMALHPIYINLKALGKIADAARRVRLQKEIESVNGLDKIDYERVWNLKMDYCRAIFGQEGEACLESAPYKAFYAANKDWLLPYAAFCALRDRFRTADFSRWGDFADFSPALVRSLSASSRYGPAMRFYLFVQYRLHEQLSESIASVHALGVALKGDIPIGVAAHSVETWTAPRLFNGEYSAGAPPDAFASDGQNWGFPTFNWEAMAADDYAWWKKRLSKMSGYFDAYRLDHVLGFFRIWEIPRTAVRSVMGHFSPALPFGIRELREDFGFEFCEARHARPFIRRFILHEIFADRADYVAERFLDCKGGDVYALKPEYDTQGKIRDLPEDGAVDETLKQGLMTLAEEVLFLPDPRTKDGFHPRILARLTYSYRCTEPRQQQAYDRLYDHFFYHRHNALWKEQALRKLSGLLASGPMLGCAEDLGMIPSCVPEVLRDLSMLSIEVQRMSKDPARTFGNPAQYPYLCVCTTSTHDTSSLRGWWEENPELSRLYYRQFLGEGAGGDTVPSCCGPRLCRRIVQAHLESPAMLCILPLQDWFSMDEAPAAKSLRRTSPDAERINIPSDPKHCWCYRMPVTLEALLARTDFQRELRRIIRTAGRI